MSRVLRSATPWMLAVLLAIAVYAFMRAEYHADRADEIQANLVRSEQRAEILLDHQRWQKRHMEAMAAVMEDREKRLERDMQIINMMRQSARDLERTDAETAEWADHPVPIVVDRWLRDLTAGADSAEPVPDDTATPDE